MQNLTSTLTAVSICYSPLPCAHCSLEIKSTTSPFLFLAVDLPPPPLFQDSVEKNIIPQVTLASVLSKFDGISTMVSLKCHHERSCFSNRFNYRSLLGN